MELIPRVLLVGGMLLCAAGCGKPPATVEGPVAPPFPAGMETAPAGPPPAQDTTYDGRIATIRDAATPSNRVAAIQQARYVTAEERPQMIAYLTDILENAPDVFDRIAAAVALIDINTPESLLPVQKTLLFALNGRLNAGIMEKLNRQYGRQYKTTINAWCTELLNDSAMVANFGEDQVIGALNLYSTTKTPESPLIDPVPFLNGPSQRIVLKMYDLMEKYPAEALPIDLLRDRITARFKAKTIDSTELQICAYLLRSLKIPPEQFKLALPADTLLWGLGHDDYAMRMAVIDIIPDAWPDLPAAGRTAVTAKIVELAEKDVIFVEGDYPVRKRAAAMNVQLYDESKPAEDQEQTPDQVQAPDQDQTPEPATGPETGTEQP